MKFNFQPEVKKLISEIIKLPVVGLNDEEDFTKPRKMIEDYLSELEKRKINKVLSSKPYSSIRRQVSFLQAVYLSCENSVENIGTESSKIRIERIKYMLFIEELASIINGASLNRPGVVKAAFNYGLISLSFFEIEKLIEFNNKA